MLEMESLLLPILARMEYQGILIDESRLQEIGRRIRHDIEKTEMIIFDTVGERFNISSPKQIQELFQRLGIPLSKKNKTGYSVDVDVLEEIAKTYDIARLILEYRSLTKLESTYVVALLKAVDSRD